MPDNHACRVLYDTLDITALLRGSGVRSAAGVAHALGIQVVPGWYGQATIRAGPPSLYLTLSITFTDGSAESIVSGVDWKAAPGPVTRSDIYAGETFDARLAQNGWSEPGFDDSAWSAAALVAPPSKTVQLSSHAIQPAITVDRSFTPMELYESAPGKWVFDFGQNMAVCSHRNLSQLIGGCICSPPHTICSLAIQSMGGMFQCFLRLWGFENAEPIKSDISVQKKALVKNRTVA